MKIENEDALDSLIICHKSHTLHQKVPIKDGAKEHVTKSAELYSIGMTAD